MPTHREWFIAISSRRIFSSTADGHAKIADFGIAKLNQAQLDDARTNPGQSGIHGSRAVERGRCGQSLLTCSPWASFSTTCSRATDRSRETARQPCVSNWSTMNRFPCRHFRQNLSPELDNIVSARNGKRPSSTLPDRHGHGL